jgi:hypothetical protein
MTAKAPKRVKVLCLACAGIRWVAPPAPKGYRCQRCRAAAPTKKAAPKRSPSYLTAEGYRELARQRSLDREAEWDAAATNAPQGWLPRRQGWLTKTNNRRRG